MAYEPIYAGYLWHILSHKYTHWYKKQCWFRNICTSLIIICLTIYNIGFVYHLITEMYSQPFKMPSIADTSCWARPTLHVVVEASYTSKELPRRGIEPRPRRWMRRILTTRPPGRVNSGWCLSWILSWTHQAPSGGGYCDIWWYVFNWKRTYLWHIWSISNLLLMSYNLKILFQSRSGINKRVKTIEAKLAVWPWSYSG